MRKRTTAVAGAGVGLLAMLGIMAAATHKSSHSMGVPASMLNPAVTQATIKTTICVSGYTAKIRPPASYTEELKVKQILELRLKDTNPTDYEEDHWIALEVGGNPTSPTNLWPELWPDAHKKDLQENRDHRAVCNGTMTLAAAQADLYNNWGRH